MKKKANIRKRRSFPRVGFGANVDTEGEVVLIPVCPAIRNLFQTLRIVVRSYV